MESRRHDFLDLLIGEIDRAIKVLTVPARTMRACFEDSAEAPAADPLPAGVRAESARLMRVNHAGEVAAQALYQGGALTARNAAVKAALQQAAAEERDHLAW